MKTLKKSLSVILALTLLLSLLACFSSCFDLSDKQGVSGIQPLQGEKGDKGDKGDSGKGILSIEKTATSGLVDTYTITYTDGSTTTFEVINGGQDTREEQGTQGGEDENNTNDWEEVNVTIYVLANNLNIRSAADTKDSDVLGIAKLGDSFVATAADKDWYKIPYDGKEAYVMAAYVTTNSAEAEFVDCEPETLKIKNTVVDPDATKDIDKYAKVMLRTDPVVSDATSTNNFLIYSDTENGELVKVAANKAGTWYKVTYQNNTYYIAGGAFKYIEGYTNSNVGGLG